MSDSPPHRIHPQHSVSMPVPGLRSALKHGDPARCTRSSPPISPPLLTSPGHVSLSTNSASPSPLISSGGYTPKVSFDTFENPAASMFSFTLSAESVGYTRTLQTRVFLCASSPDESGSQALDWALDSLVQDGDEIVVFRGFDEDDLGTSPPRPPSGDRACWIRHRSLCSLEHMLTFHHSPSSQRSRRDPGRSSRTPSASASQIRRIRPWPKGACVTFPLPNTTVHPQSALPRRIHFPPFLQYRYAIPD